MQEKYDVVVAGGGVVGLSVAWRLAELGLQTVLVHDSAARTPASWVAAGMLAPVTEAAYGEDELLAANLRSLRDFPEFLSALSAAAGREVKAWPQRTIFAALDRDQAEALRRLFDFQQSLGLQVNWLDRRACRAEEPSLHTSTIAGILAAGDTAVDPRDLLDALAVAVKQAGAAVIEGVRVSAVEPGDPAALVCEDGRRFIAGHIVMAAGCWTGSVEGLPPWTAQCLRPVKGQILRLSPRGGRPCPIAHVVRTEEVYLVPRPSGEVAVGATVEEQGFDTAVTADAVFELLRSAQEAVPEIREMVVSELSAGLRPGTPDNAPLIGPAGLEGITLATGHYRNGILLAPATADAIAEMVTAGKAPEWALPFSPLRFAA